MLVAIILLLIVFLYLVLFYKENFKDKTRPPGPYRFPPFGNLIQIRLTSEFAHVALDKLARRYGDAMSIKMGFLETVILSSPEAVRLVFSRDEASVRECSGLMFDRNLKQNIGLVFCNGPEQTELRKFCRDTLRHYGYGYRESMQLLVLDELTEVVTIVEMKARSNPDGIVHFASDYFTASLLNLMCKLILGKRYDYNDPVFQKTVQAVNLLMKNGVVGSGIMLAYPFLRHIFPDSLGYTKQMKGVRLMSEIALKHLNERRKFYKDEPECFVDNFLEKMDEEANKPRSLYTVDCFSIIFGDIMAAGSDTTSIVVHYIILFLATYQTIQEKVYQEILQFIGPDRQPHLKNKPEMLYTQAVLLEVMRWNREVVFGGPRVAKDDFTYREKYLIKKGTVLMYNLQSLFFDERIWGDPEVFRPERFLDNEQLNEEKSSIIQIVFGAGKRNCFGEVLARDSLFLYTTTLMQKFKFTLPPGHHPDLEPGVGMALYAKPFDAIVTLRNESDSN